MRYVFVNLQVVGGSGQGIEFEADFSLARRHFVVVLLHVHAHLAHDGDHFGAQVAL